MDTEIISVVSALAGVALGQVLARNGEYRKWLRTEQHKAATELLAAGEALRRGVYTRWHANHDDETRAVARAEMLADRERLRVALEAFRLVFPGPVVERAKEYFEVAEAYSRINVNKRVVSMQPGAGYADYFEVRDGLSAAASLTVAPRSGLGLRARLALRQVPEVSAELPAADDDEVE